MIHRTACAGLALAACLTLSQSAAATRRLTLPANARYTITEADLEQSLPAGCTSYTSKWYKNGVLTGISTPTYTILPNSLMEGHTYTFLRSVLCGGCPPVLHSPQLLVSITPPAYPIFDCSATQVFGRYEKNVAVNSSHYISLKIVSPVAGLPWKITTYVAHGLQLRGEGVLAKGDNTVTLSANGIPDIYGPITFTVNDDESLTYGAALCPLSVRVVLPNINLVFYSSNNAWDMYSSTGTNPAYNAMEAGRAGGRFPYFDADTLVHAGAITASRRTSESVGVTENDHIVIWSYYVAVQSRFAELASKVKSRQGVVVLMLGENMGSYTAMQAALDAQFGSSAKGSSGLTISNSKLNYDEASVFQPGAPVVSGPVFNLSGKRFGVDGDGNYYFTNVDTTKWWTVAGSSFGGSTFYASIVMHKAYPLIIIGDAGALAGGNNMYSGYSDGVYFPVWTTADGLPMEKSYGGIHFTPPVHNSYFYVNVLVWALRQWEGR